MISKSPAQAGDFHLSKNFYFLRVFLISASIAARNFPLCLRRCGRGILKGAAFRQRPLSRLLLKVLAETRTLPPEAMSSREGRAADCHTSVAALVRNDIVFCSLHRQSRGLDNFLIL